MNTVLNSTVSNYSKPCLIQSVVSLIARVMVAIAMILKINASIDINEIFSPSIGCIIP